MSEKTNNLRFVREHSAEEALDASLRPVAESLDRLARAEQGEPAESFESRIAQSTHFALSASAKGSHFQLRLVLRIAAAIAVLVAGVAGVMMIRGGAVPLPKQLATNDKAAAPAAPVTGSLDYDDVYSIAAAAFDGGAGEEIDTLFTDASDLGSKIAKGLTPSEEPLEGSTM